MVLPSPLALSNDLAPLLTPLYFGRLEPTTLVLLVATVVVTAVALTVGVTTALVALFVVTVTFGQLISNTATAQITASLRAALESAAHARCATTSALQVFNPSASPATSAPRPNAASPDA